MAPKAAQIKGLFEARGETVCNDHVAFRTYGLNPIDLESLEKPVLELGYKRYEPYRFEAKKLNAYGYIDPEGKLPRIFLSALEVESLSDQAQEIIHGLVNQVDPERVLAEDLLWAGRLWSPVSHGDYLKLLDESEYAAWVAAHGIRPNHFTISVTDLKQTPSLQEVLDIVQAAGFAINESGGRIKGSPEVLLEQGSTMAERMDVEFAGAEMHSIPTCYYEFARRYPDREGRLYQGFVAASADKIFESTDVKSHT